MENGEIATETLIRELWEELRCHVEVRDMLFVTEVLGQTRHIIQFTFQIDTDQQEFVIGDDPILGNYDFFSADQISKLDLYPDMKKQLINFINGNKNQKVYHVVDWI